MDLLDQIERRLEQRGRGDRLRRANHDELRRRVVHTRVERTTTHLWGTPGCSLPGSLYHVIGEVAAVPCGLALFSNLTDDELTDDVIVEAVISATEVFPDREAVQLPMSLAELPPRASASRRRTAFIDGFCAAVVAPQARRRCFALALDVRVSSAFALRGRVRVIGLSLLGGLGGASGFWLPPVPSGAQLEKEERKDLEYLRRPHDNEARDAVRCYS